MAAYAGFKKIKEDKDSATMKHPEGHEIRIAKKGLSPKMLKDLASLPLHKGGPVRKYAEGDEVAPIQVSGSKLESQYVPEDAAAQEAADPTNPATSPDAFTQPPQSVDQQTSADTAGPTSQNLQDAATPPAQATGPQPEQTFQDAKMAGKQALDAEDQAWQKDLYNGHVTPETYKSLFAKKDTLGKIGTVFGMLLAGAGSGLTHQPNALLGLMQKQIDNDLDAQKNSKLNAQNFLRLTQQNELNKSQILLNLKSGKLTEAQAKNQLQDISSKSYALAQSKMLQSTYHDLVSKTDKMPEGPQKEAAKQQLALIYSKIGGQINNINDQAAGASAYSNMLFGNAPGQPGSAAPTTEQGFQKTTTNMKMLGPQGEARAKDLEEKHVPGFPGQASFPVPPADREELNSGVQFDQKLDRFRDWTKNHSGDLSPTDRHEGEALAAEVQGAYRQATHGGVYKEGEQNFISKIIDSDPTKFFNSIRVMPQLNAVSKENKLRVDQKAKSLGLPGYTPAATQAAAPQEKIQYSGGKAYKLDPTGKFMIPVK